MNWFSKLLASRTGCGQNLASINERDGAASRCATVLNHPALGAPARGIFFNCFIFIHPAKICGCDRLRKAEVLCAVFISVRSGSSITRRHTHTYAAINRRTTKGIGLFDQCVMMMMRWSQRNDERNERRCATVAVIIRVRITPYVRRGGSWNCKLACNTAIKWSQETFRWHR